MVCWIVITFDILLNEGIGDELCVSHSSPSSVKSMEMLEKLLERISKSEASFLFWYDLFRDAYLTVSLFACLCFFVKKRINLNLLEILCAAR